MGKETRTERDFAARPPEERAWMLENTWCDACNEADLGMNEPREYEEDGRVLVEGQCLRCLGDILVEVTELGG